MQNHPSNPPPVASNDPPPYTPTEPTSSSRETIIHRTSNTISGSYDLLDLLKLSTVSATINVSVDPKKANGTSIAKFVACTTSGTIHARFPSFADDIPIRDFHTTVDSTSGSLGGTYVLGSTTSFRSNSGSLNLALTPVTGNYGTELVTHTVSGGHTIDVLSGDSKAVANLIVRCRSSSGSITIRVPSDFSGTIAGKSTSGSVHIGGKGVKITNEERWSSGKRIEASKGDGNGRISVETVSGSVDIKIC